MISIAWLLSAGAALLFLQLTVIGLIFVRNGLVQLRLRRRRRRCAALSQMYDALAADQSVNLRLELARAEILRDIASLENWLDIVVERGDDPARLAPADYEHNGLVERYLHQLKHDRRWARRATAAEILGWSRSPAAVDALIDTALDVSGEPPNVRAVALRALGRIEHPAAVPRLLETLDSTETWFPPRAAAMLSRMGASAVDPLISLLGDASAPITRRRWAARILGSIADPRSRRPLQRALGDIDPELRASAAKALGDLADESSVENLLDLLLADPIAFVRTNVARALGCIAAESAVQYLTGALADPDWWVRLRAVEALAHLGRRAEKPLLGALYDRDTQVAHEAARSLERIGVVGELMDALSSEGYRPEIDELLIDVGRAGNLEPLLDALHSHQAELVRLVVRILGRVGDTRAAVPLVDLLLRTERPGLQARILHSLHKIKAGDQIETVIRFIDSPDEWVRKTAVEYLERFADPDKLPALEHLLIDPNPWSREAALRLLQRAECTPASVDALCRALSDGYAFVRAQAVRGLLRARRHDVLLDQAIAQDGDPEVLDALRSELEATMTPEAMPLVLAVFERMDENGLESLGRAVVAAAQEDSRACLTFVRGRRDVGSRWIVAKMALVVRDHRLPIPLDELLQDEDPRVRSAAVTALGGGSNTVSRPRARALAATKDESRLVVSSALRVLASLPGRDIEMVLRKHLKHGETEVAVDAAFALALRPEGRGWRSLLGATSHRERAVRMAAAMGLLTQGEYTALPFWLHAVRDPQSVEILLGWERTEHPLFGVVRALAGVPSAPLAKRLLTASSAGEVEDTLLAELDTNPDEAARVLAVECLRTLGSRRGIGRILNASGRDPSARVRAAALTFLVGDDLFERRLEFLDAGLKDPILSVQLTAAHLTVALDDDDAIAVLARHLDTGRSTLREALADMLAGRFEAGLEPIVDAILSRPESTDLYLGLVAVLERIPLPPPAHVLRSLLDHRWAPVRQQALKALAPRLAAESGRRVIQALADPSELVRIQAVRMICSLRIDYSEMLPERATALNTLLSDPDPRVRLRCALAIGKLELGELHASVEALLEDSHGQVRRAAARCLIHLPRVGKSKPEELAWMP